MTDKRYKISAGDYILVTLDICKACDKAMEHISLPANQAAKKELRIRFAQRLSKLEKGEILIFHGICAMVY